MAEIYPLALTFEEIEVVVDRGGWAFADEATAQTYNALPVLKRMELRKQFELQVQLAQNTPTKGDR